MHIKIRILQSKPVEDGLGLSYFYPLEKGNNKVREINLCLYRHFFHLLCIYSWLQKPWKIFNSLSYVKLLGWRRLRKRHSKGDFTELFKTSGYFLQKNEGYDTHFWADFTMVPDPLKA